MTYMFVFAGIMGGMAMLGCQQNNNKVSVAGEENVYFAMNMSTDTATFGTGCFWCTEAVFQELKGVHKVTSGYSGGHVANPTYEEVCSKKTGHAEVVQVVYDPTVITFDELLEVFFQVHDPTTLNRQGADVGPQYRSAIFFHNKTQQEKAVYYKDALNKSGAYPNPIVTEISAFKAFYPAEDYHQNFYTNNPNYGYCSYVIKPKLDKFRQVFEGKLRRNHTSSQ